MFLLNAVLFQRVAKSSLPLSRSGNREHVGGLERPPDPRCAAGFRRRRYEMAESACVTEAQRLGHVEAAHVFCGDPGLLV